MIDIIKKVYASLKDSFVAGLLDDPATTIFGFLSTVFGGMAILGPFQEYAGVFGFLGVVCGGLVGVFARQARKEI